MRSNLRGAILIEVSVAAGVFLVGLTAVFLTFIQINRSSARNRETSLALNLIASQIEQDSQYTYSEITAQYPALLTSSQLPTASIERIITDNPRYQIKTIRYIVQWNGQYGKRTIHSDYEITNAGVGNAEVQ